MDANSIRITPEQWQAACPTLKRVGSQLEGPCPSCGGENRFHIKLEEPYLWGCRQCEDAPAILAAAFPESRPPRAAPRSFVVATYHHPDGRITEAHRKDWPADWDGQPCSWPDCKSVGPHKHCWKRKGQPQIGLFLHLWAPAQPLSADVVVITEGEKAAAAVQSAGYVAASYYGGSKNAKAANYSPVEGRIVVVWPDDDTPGRTAAVTSAQKAHEAGALSVHMVATPNANTGADAADHTADAVRSMIEAALADGEIAPQDAAAGIQGPPTKPDTVITETVTGLGVLLDYLKLEMRYNARGVRIESRRSDWPGPPARRWAGQWGRDVGPDGWVELSDEMEAQLYNVSREFFNFTTPAGWPVRAVWSERSLRAAIMGAYEGKVVDPFAQWLEKLPAWDGVERMSELWITPLLMPDTELNREAGGRFLIGGVRRAFEPGCVHDWIPVLVGPQGIGKSSMLKTLLPYSEWLSDSVGLDDDRKERIEGAGPAVIVEYSEMAGLSKADSRAFKNSLSVPTDRVRLPWGRHSVGINRRWVGVGTANGGMDGVLPYDESGQGAMSSWRAPSWGQLTRSAR